MKRCKHKNNEVLYYKGKPSMYASCKDCGKTIGNKKQEVKKVGVCKGCGNDIFNWDNDNTPKDYHDEGIDYNCKNP